MEMDLERTQYNHKLYNEYIYGSAEVVGLMCLYVFVEGDKKMFEALRPSARALGAAFQKVNFLRDLKADYYLQKPVDLTGYFEAIRDIQNFWMNNFKKGSYEVQ